jgi:hypothetical protein
VFAQVNGSVLVGGIDRPPRESLEQWLARRRRELTVLDSQAEHAPSPPNGNWPSLGEQSRCARTVLSRCSSR